MPQGYDTDDLAMDVELAQLRKQQAILLKQLQICPLERSLHSTGKPTATRPFNTSGGQSVASRRSERTAAEGNFYVCSHDSIL